jgi:hypothetical protein
LLGECIFIRSVKLWGFLEEVFEGEGVGKCRKSFRLLKDVFEGIGVQIERLAACCRHDGG